LYSLSSDFVLDACANGQQLKCLMIIDEYTGECLAIDVAEFPEPLLVRLDTQGRLVL